MAATDILTEAEAKRAVSHSSATGDVLAEIVQMNSQVADDFDRLCGAVVVRTVTDELHDGVGTRLFLRQPPIASVTSVTEYVSGSGTALTLESVTVAGGYLADLNSGFLERRSSWLPMEWAGRVAVTYTAGRYASTAAVAAGWKGKAAAALRRKWREEAPVWARTPDFNGGDDEEFPGMAYNDAFLRSVLGSLVRADGFA